MWRIALPLAFLLLFAHMISAVPIVSPTADSNEDIVRTRADSEDTVSDKSAADGGVFAYGDVDVAFYGSIGSGSIEYRVDGRGTKRDVLEKRPSEMSGVPDWDNWDDRETVGEVGNTGRGFITVDAATDDSEYNLAVRAEDGDDVFVHWSKKTEDGKGGKQRDDNEPEGRMERANEASHLDSAIKM